MNKLFVSKNTNKGKQAMNKVSWNQNFLIHLNNNPNRLFIKKNYFRERPPWCYNYGQYMVDIFVFVGLPFRKTLLLDTPKPQLPANKDFTWKPQIWKLQISVFLWKSYKISIENPLFCQKRKTLTDWCNLLVCLIDRWKERRDAERTKRRRSGKTYNKLSSQNSTAEHKA